jgi:hypothetical protein
MFLICSDACKCLYDEGRDDKREYDCCLETHIADSILSPQELAANFPPHCRLIAAQRAAGEALAGTLKPQLRPSALLPVLPAAKAALEALMQTTSNVAATISMVNFMARLSPKSSQNLIFRTPS